MPRTERGILGYKKDPKQQILFTVGRTGDDWPSDSDDSDYCPSNFEAERTDKRRKRKYKRNEECSDDKNKQHKQSKKKRKIGKGMLNQNISSTQQKRMTTPSNQNLTEDTWSQLIPPEILLKIFSMVVEDKGPLPFLPRASRVCHLWRSIAFDSSLWQNIDLSFGWIKRDSKKLLGLFKNRLSNATVKKLDLRGWQKCVDQQMITEIAKYCPHLEEINLQGCMRIRSEGLSSVIKQCPHLHSLDLSQEASPDFRTKSDVMSAKSLNDMIELVGSRLQALNLSYHRLSGFSPVFRNIYKKCPNLRCLELNGIITTDYLPLNIEQLQEGCPQLEILSLSCTEFRSSSYSSMIQSNGFPKLKKLFLMCMLKHCGLGPCDQDVQRLLRNSKNLEVLDLTGCKNVTANCLYSLCCNDVTHLYLQWSSVPKREAIASVFNKWNHSLIELNLNNCQFSLDFPDAIKEIAHPNSKLCNLYLTATNITTESLKAILNGCQNVTSLDITSCRSLDKGLKRSYDRNQLFALRRTLKL